MLAWIIRVLRGQAVLGIAFLCAVASMLAVGDASLALGSIDWRVIGLLFCLMAAVAGLRKSGLLGHVARKMVQGRRTQRLTCFALVMLPFFASMLVTNDVALIAFAPLAAVVLEMAGWKDRLAYVVVLQTIAANLGGMVTPVGNPQNLFIYTSYQLQPADFFAALAPFGLLAWALLALACLRCGRQVSTLSLQSLDAPLDAKSALLHGALFLVGVLAVLRLIDWPVALAVVALALLLFDRGVYRHVDYGLLATFACFFVFSGNLAHLPQLSSLLQGLMTGHPMLTSLLASQVISNVPAAVLLSGFTENWHSLLIGVDLGGLGTPIASLASLISLKIYLYSPGSSLRAFMGPFLALNASMLVALLALYAILWV